MQHSNGNTDLLSPPAEEVIEAIIGVADQRRIWSFPEVDEAELAALKRKAAEILAESGLVRQVLAASPPINCEMRFVFDTGLPQVWQRDGGCVIQVPADDPEAPVTLWQAYKQEEKRKTESADPWAAPPPDNADRVSAQQRIDHNAQLGFHGRSGTFDVSDFASGKADGARIEHTWGDILRYQAMKQDWVNDPEKYPAWAMERDKLLSDEMMDKLKPNQWFRRMCVLNGLSTPDLAALSKYAQNSWTNLQNRELKGGYPLTLPLVLFLLETFVQKEIVRGRDSTIFPGQLLGLPTVSWGPPGQQKEIVDPRIAQKILNKFGFKDVLYPQQMAELAIAALETTAQLYKNGQASEEEIKNVGPQIAKQLLRDKRPMQFFEKDSKEFRISSNYLVDKTTDPEPMITLLGKMYPEYAERIAHALRVLQFPDNRPFCSPLSKGLAFEIAKNHSHSTGDFFKRYRLARGLSLDSAILFLGTTRQNISQLEAATYSKPETINRYLNATRRGNVDEAEQPGPPEHYFPVDESGHVRADAIEYVNEINKAGHPTNRFLSEIESTPETKVSTEQISVRARKEKNDIVPWS